MPIVDVSKIVLNKDELMLLKRIRKAGRATLSNAEARIISGKGLTIHVPPATNNAVILQLSETGERYFTYQHERKKELWLVSFKIPVLVSIVTTVLINLLLLMLPYLHKWLDGVFSKGLFPL